MFDLVMEGIIELFADHNLKDPSKEGLYDNR